MTYIDPKMDGRHLISNSKDQSVKLWDIRRYWYRHNIVIIPVMDPFSRFSSQSAIEQSRVIIADQKWDYRWQRVPR